MKQLGYTIFMCLLLLQSAQAQSYRLRANLHPVTQTGFHRIALPPDLVGQLNNSFTDIRLYDAQQQEVPYQLQREQAAAQAVWVDYELISRTARPRANTTLIIRNKAHDPISSLALLVKNANVSKKARLSGSTDAQTWYAIDDEIWLEPVRAAQQTANTQVLHFPLSDYAYYRLDINDSVSTPLNILRIGHYEERLGNRAYTAIPNLTFTQRDSSDKRTYIHLVRPTAARFDKLIILMQDTAPFRRRAMLGFMRNPTRKHRHTNPFFTPIRTLTLQATDSNVVQLPGLKANELYLVIENDDNRPLKPARIQGFQLSTYLVANLHSGEAYQLAFSGNNSPPPVYDQTVFQHNTTEKLPIVTIEKLSPEPNNPAHTSVFFTDKRIIWPVLGLVLLLLGFFSFRMIQDLKKTDQPSGGL